MILCICCPVLRPAGRPRLPTAPQVCDGCRERLAGDLRALPDAFASVELEAIRAGGERHASGFESRPPLNLTALSLLGPGTDTPLARLDSWVQDWAGIRAETLPVPVVTTVCLWLSTRLPWACDSHPAVDEFAVDLRDLSGALRAFTGRDRGEPVGRCPRRIGDEPCNTALYVDPYVDEIQCPRCRQTWKRRAGEWMHLRAQQLSANVEVAV